VSFVGAPPGPRYFGLVNGFAGEEVTGFSGLVNDPRLPGNPLGKLGGFAPHLSMWVSG
jgi:hypothetical protein